MNKTSSRPDSLAGKIAIVTGSTRGLGLAMAEGLALAGARVIVTGRSAEQCDAVAQSLTGRGLAATGRALDVRDVESTRAAIEAIHGEFGAIDVLVNNAGIEQVHPSLDLTEAIWDTIQDTNLKAAFFCAQTCARLMRPGSSIINICSLTSEAGVPGAAPYSASKAGLAGLTRTLATEWAPLGIRVNGIAPGYFRTDLTEVFYADENWARTMVGKIPMQRFGEAADLAGLPAVMASEAFRYVTGQILYVDGGFMASI